MQLLPLFNFNHSRACDEVELMLRQSETQLHKCFQRLAQPAIRLKCVNSYTTTSSSLIEVKRSSLYTTGVVV